MIKKLRKRFTAVLMGLLALVMLAVICAIYIFMYRSEVHNAERIISYAESIRFGERFDKNPPPEDDQSGYDRKREPDIRFENSNMPVPDFRKMNDFSSGWIRVSLDENDDITDIFYSQQRFFSDEEESESFDAAVSLAAKKIVARNEADGFVTAENTSYRYRVSENDSEKIIIMLDRTAEMSTMNRLLMILLGIFFLSLIVLFIISVLLSKWAVVPIEDAWNRQKIFFSNASHELKTPLTVISANLDVITSNPSETVESQKKWFGFIREEADKMSRLINEMLFLSREEQNTETVTAEFDLSEAAEGACLSMDAVAFEHGRTLSQDIEEGIIYKGDRESICRMLHILIDNAVAHSSEGSEIRVSLKRSRGKIKLMVSNEGKPIPSEELERIFDRYYRTDASRSRDTGGFGLGLAIAKAIVHKHGGTLTARSDENATIFTAVL